MPSQSLLLRLQVFLDGQAAVCAVELDEILLHYTSPPSVSCKMNLTSTTASAREAADTAMIARFDKPSTSVSITFFIMLKCFDYGTNIMLF